MRTRTPLVTCCALLLLLVTSCAKKPKPVTEPAELQHLVYHRTGGFAGVDDRLEIKPDGRAGGARRGERPRELRLTRTQTTLIADALRGFESLESNYPAPRGAADGFNYELRYGRKRVTASEANPDVPPRLREALLMLDAVLQQQP